MTFRYLLRLFRSSLVDPAEEDIPGSHILDYCYCNLGSYNPGYCCYLVFHNLDLHFLVLRNLDCHNPDYYILVGWDNQVEVQGFGHIFKWFGWEEVHKFPVFYFS